jgi:hypothetical protein
MILRLGGQSMERFQIDEVSLHRLIVRVGLSSLLVSVFFFTGVLAYIYTIFEPEAWRVPIYAALFLAFSPAIFISSTVFLIVNRKKQPATSRN